MFAVPVYLQRLPSQSSLAPEITAPSIRQQMRAANQAGARQCIRHVVWATYAHPFAHPFAQPPHSACRAMVIAILACLSVCLSVCLHACMHAWAKSRACLLLLITTTTTTPPPHPHLVCPTLAQIYPVPGIALAIRPDLCLARPISITRSPSRSRHTLLRSHWSPPQINCSHSVWARLCNAKSALETSLCRCVLTLFCVHVNNNDAVKILVCFLPP